MTYTDDERPQEPVIYIACAAAAAQNILHGVWTDAAQPADRLHAVSAHVVRTSPAKDASETFIRASDGWHGLDIPSYCPMNAIARAAAIVKTYGAPAARLLERNGMDATGAEIIMREEYRGDFPTPAAWCEFDLSPRLEAIPVVLPHIRWGAVAADREARGEVTFLRSTPDAVHVFVR